MCQVVQTTEDALTTRVLQATIHTLELYGIYLGKELGLYEALKSGRRITPPELARAAGIAPRYAREWLEQQAVAGFLRVESPNAPAESRRYWLPAEHMNVLAADDHPSHLAPMAQMVAGVGGALERVVNAYRSGGGVAYPHFGAAFRAGQAGINRPAYSVGFGDALDSRAARPPQRADVDADACGRRRVRRRLVHARDGQGIPQGRCRRLRRRPGVGVRRPAERGRARRRRALRRPRR